MSVERADLNKCIGCRNCINICPMDVFRFDEENRKSIIAYPENCMSCGQCYVNCLGHSLQISNNNHMYVLTSMRATTEVPKNRIIMSGINGWSKVYAKTEETEE